MRTQLKTAMLESGKAQYMIAREAGMSETRLSRIVMDRLEPTGPERRRLARVLKVAEEALFSGAASDD